MVTPTPTPVTPVTTPTLPAFTTSSTTQYFADGYTGTAASNGKATFIERLFLYNPGSMASSVTTTYYVTNPSSSAHTMVTEQNSVAPGATVVRNVNQDVGNDRFVTSR